MNTIEISGHRGFKSREIENTREAFLRAIKAGIDYVELDLKATVDGIPVVFHDSSLKRLLGVDERISKITLDELQQFKYKDGQEVLSFREFLELIGNDIKPMVEIKAKGIAKKVVSMIKEYGLQDTAIIQSFNGCIIKRCHAIAPHFKYGLCLGPLGGIGSLGKRMGLQQIIARFIYLVAIRPYPVNYLNLDGPFIYKEIIDLCNAKGKRIILGAKKTWNYLDKLREWNVEIVNADDPVLIRELIQKMPSNKVSPDSIPQ